MSDITKLKGDDLFAALSASVKSGKKIKCAGKKKVPPKRVVDRAELWTDKAVVMMMECKICHCCGSSYETPVSHPMIRRHSKKHGIHYSALGNFSNAELLFLDLPFEIEKRYTEVPACPLCFDITKLIHYAQEGKPCPQTQTNVVEDDEPNNPEDAEIQAFVDAVRDMGAVSSKE